MTSSLVSANPAVNSTTRRRRTTNANKKKPQFHNSGENLDDRRAVEWKSEAQQQIYSSKLIQALRQVRLSSSAGGGDSSSSPPGPKRVHEAADRVLAATARGRTRWSRAILTNRLKLKFMKKNNIVKRESKVMAVITGDSSRSSQTKKSKLKILRLKSKSMPAVQRKARVLSRLVPGCQKQPLPVVLEEATDYIAALEMQVRAMTAVAELLAGAGAGQNQSVSNSSTGRNPPG